MAPRQDGTRIRSSPGYAFSTPPLKKYVTWAYFSVSASAEVLDPRARPHVGEDVGQVLGRKRGRQAELRLVLG